MIPARRAGQVRALIAAATAIASTFRVGIGAPLIAAAFVVFVRDPEPQMISEAEREALLAG